MPCTRCHGRAHAHFGICLDYYIWYTDLYGTILLYLAVCVEREAGRVEHKLRKSTTSACVYSIYIWNMMPLHNIIVIALAASMLVRFPYYASPVSVWTPHILHTGTSKTGIL